jgi:pSer/pThr/pTyr-binding forkhead associated (FHA) protein
MRKLLVTSGSAAGHELELEQELVVGREDADLVIADSEMSRRHAVLRPVDQGVEVEDLGSTNGTYVDGERISRPVTITIHGTVRMGTSELAVDVSLPETTRIAPGQPQATLIGSSPGLAATVAREVPVPLTAPADEPFEPGSESRIESPHLPIPASIAIFVGCVVAIVVVLVLTH